MSGHASLLKPPAVRAGEFVQGGPEERVTNLFGLCHTVTLYDLTNIKERLLRIEGGIDGRLGEETVPPA